MGSQRELEEISPFPGLRPFTTADSRIFFGRNAESDNVISKLLKSRYVTIIGSSGTGKSSLVFSGVIPKIRNLMIRDSSVWRFISIRPGNDPFKNLASAVSDGIRDSAQKRIESNLILTELLRDNCNFSDIVKKYLINHDDNILLVVDQLEELFRYPGITQGDAIRFIEFLVNSTSKPDANVFIVATMRSEYLSECCRYKGLAMLVNNSNYLVPEPGEDNMREIIEKPLNLNGVLIEPELVDILIGDLKERNDQLPVFQQAMMRTYDHWRQFNESRPITKLDYESIGTVKNAISGQANEIYEKLDRRGKEICEIMFKTITKKGSDQRGIRNPASVETIASIAGCSEKELSDVAENFRKSSFLYPPENVAIGKSSIIDLQNEFLIGLWDKLREWMDQEASSARIYLHLSEASALYQAGKTGLYRASDLQSAIKWREQFKPVLSWAVQYNPAFERAMVYLRTSEKAFFQEEENKHKLQTISRKRTGFILRFFGIAVLIATGLSVYSYLQKINAETLSIIAEKTRSQAVEQKVKSDSIALIATGQKILSDSSARVAIKNAAEFREKQIVAEKQKSFAEKNASEALHDKSLAIEQRNGTQRLRMISVGKTMSLKSLQMNDKKDLQALLAYQAYLFNKKNNGPDNDADIYAGLYNVGLQYGSVNYKSFKGHNGEIKSIAFIPGKNEFFTSGNDGQVLKWSLDKKDQTLQVVYSGSEIIEVLAVSPDASWLACGGANSSIRMIPLKGNNISYEMNGHKGGVKSLIFSYDGRYLYSAALDGKVLQWDIAARTSINVATGSMEISSLDISSKGNYLAGISADGNVVVWNPDHFSDNFRIEATGKKIKVVRFNPENNLLAVGDTEGNIEIWDIEHHSKISSVKAHDSQVTDIQFNKGLKQMATSGNDKKIRIFDFKDPGNLTEPPVTLADNDGFILVMQFSTDGQMIISGESGGADNLIGRATHVDYLVQDICSHITRNMTQEEWNAYVGKDIPLEKTCRENNLKIKVEPISSISK